MLEIADEINEKLLGICAPDTELYIVGGYIRDVVLKQECFDRDYAVKGQSAIQLAKKAADMLDGYFVELDRKHDIARVVLPDRVNTLDFAGCVGNDIYTDLQNRDYTINAAACRLYPGYCELIDPLKGLEDIEKGVIRAISENNLISDPLRLLRAFRLAARFNFVIEPLTLELIARNYFLIKNIAFERINNELVKLFESENTAKNLVLMKNTDILFEIIPELAAQKDVPPNRHHHLSLIDHSIETVRQVERNMKDFPVEKPALLKLAALLHDIGKPATWTIDREGRDRFIKHEEIGAQMALEVLKTLKFSKKDTNYVSMLIKNHLYPSQLIREGMENLSDRALMRFYRRIMDNVPALLLLAMADRLSARGPEITDDIVERNIQGIYALLERFKATQEQIRHIPKLLDGREVMEILNIPKGPLVGKALKTLKEAQIAGDVNTREDAVAFILSNVPN